MTSHVKLRRERVGLVDYETQIKGNVTLPRTILLVLLLLSSCQHACCLWRGKGAVWAFSLPANHLSNHIFSRHSFSEMRCQLVDQLKVFDLQLEQKSQQLQELTDYLRRRSEIESEYARSLDKLADRFASRIKR